MKSHFGFSGLYKQQPMHRNNPMLRYRQQTTHKPRDPDTPSVFSVLVMMVMASLYASLVYYILDRNNSLPEDGIEFACMCLAPPTIVIGVGIVMLQCILG